MFKVTFCLHRLRGMTREEFQTYWRDVHGPLLEQHKEALWLRRYVQTHTLPEGSVPNLEREGMPEVYDGITELWYDSREDYQAMIATPEGRKIAKILYEDTKKFIDNDRSTMFAGEEHILIDG